MKIKRFLGMVFILAIAASSIDVSAATIAQPLQQQYDKTLTGTIPDLDQNRDYTGDLVAEQNWCAPTAAANSVWYFGSGGFPNLIPAGANNDVRADSMIKILGALMGTNDPNGTTVANAVAGLQQHFDNNYSGSFSVSWNSAFSLLDATSNPSAQNLWNWMTTSLLSSADVLPIIWLPWNGQNGHQGAPSEDSGVVQTKLDSLEGHLVTMTGYDIQTYPGSINVLDPDDQVGVGHTWPPNTNPLQWNLTIAGSAPQGTALAINGGAGGWIVGAIVAVPEPSMILPLSVSLLLIARRKKR